MLRCGQPNAALTKGNKSMFALNFYAEYYEDVLRNGRKSVTIRLGDKSTKYEAGMIVWVTVGPRFGRRHKLFAAILDRVEVKTIDQLSPREIQKENPEFRTAEDLVQLMRRIYTDDISVEDTVTVIHFSPVSEY
jgi:hypothetical protein